MSIVKNPNAKIPAVLSNEYLELQSKHDRLRAAAMKLRDRVSSHTVGLIVSNAIRARAITEAIAEFDEAIKGDES